MDSLERGKLITHHQKVQPERWPPKATISFTMSTLEKRQKRKQCRYLWSLLGKMNRRQTIEFRFLRTFLFK